MGNNMFIQKYKTLDGYSNMLMSSDGIFLTGLWFEGSKDALKHCSDFEEKNLPVFEETKKWLDIYFSGEKPQFIPKYKVNNLTSFRKQVIDIMIKIPYGKLISYNDIAKEIAKKNGIEKMSAQAVGGAVGWNPICLVIPCHRVIGANGNLTGYGGGIQNKIKLLELEKNDMNRFTIPKDR